VRAQHFWAGCGGKEAFSKPNPPARLPSSHSSPSDPSSTHSFALNRVLSSTHAAELVNHVIGLYRKQ
jgi:hypothetical protein